MPLRWEKVQLGSCRLLYGGADLGTTRGGTVLRYLPDVLELSADTLGRAAYDVALRGEAVRVQTQLLAETWASLRAAFPGGTYVEGAGSAKLTFGGAPRRLGASARELVLHPLDMPDDDPSADVWIWRAVAASQSERGYRLDGERVIPVEFRGLLDVSRPRGQQLFGIGVELLHRIEVWRGAEQVLPDTYADVRTLRGDGPATHRVVLGQVGPAFAPGDEVREMVDTLLHLGLTQQEQARARYTVVGAADHGSFEELEVIRS